MEHRFEKGHKKIGGRKRGTPNKPPTLTKLEKVMLKLILIMQENARLSREIIRLNQEGGGK